MNFFVYDLGELWKLVDSISVVLREFEAAHHRNHIFPEQDLIFAFVILKQLPSKSTKRSFFIEVIEIVWQVAFELIDIAEIELFVEILCAGKLFVDFALESDDFSAFLILEQRVVHTGFGFKNLQLFLEQGHILIAFSRRDWNLGLDCETLVLDDHDQRHTYFALVLGYP